jgi:hypothetical protein
MRFSGIVPVTLVLALHALPQAPARPSTLSDVMKRAAQYAADYGDALSTVLAEEHSSERLGWIGNRLKNLESSDRRELVAEIAFVHLARGKEWLAFRNVVEVDGTAVPDTAGRFERSIAAASATNLDQFRRIASESARYNLGPITREINVPTFVLHYLNPQRQRNTHFTKEADDVVNGEQAWVVRFREDAPGSLIMRGDGKALRGEGRMWIVPESGRLVRSELVVKEFVRGDGNSRAQIEVVWRRDQDLDLWVPAQMKEHFEGKGEERGPGVRFAIDGLATYTKYRRFSTSFKIR